MENLASVFIIPRVRNNLTSPLDIEDVMWYTTGKSRDTQMPEDFTLHSNLPSDESHGVKVALDSRKK